MCGSPVSHGRLLTACLVTLLAGRAGATDSFAQWSARDRAAWDAFAGARRQRAADLPGRATERADPGQWIFFVKKHVMADAPLGDIYAIRPDGTQLRRITSFAPAMFTCDLPELAPDGRHLVFISNYESWLSAFYKDAFTPTWPRTDGTWPCRPA